MTLTTPIWEELKKCESYSHVTNIALHRYADMKAKAIREEEDTQRKMSANMDMLSVLNQQVAAAEAQKQEEIKLIEEERQLLVRWGQKTILIERLV